MGWEDEIDYQEIAESFYDEHYSRAIDEFQQERLTSYYLKHPFLSDSAYRSLVEARKLLAESHPTAAFIFAAIALEVT